jgi:NADH-quinone oxidoreductase subunit C
MKQRRNSDTSRQHEVPTAPIRLNEMSGALLATLKRDLGSDSYASISAEVDIVTVTIPGENIVEFCNFLKTSDTFKFDYLCSISVVDYEEQENKFEIVYHLVSLTKRHKLALKTSVSADNAIVPSVIGVWRTADWFERESHDLFGVVFDGHPNLAPLLLYDGFDGFPGRKSFPFHDYQEW